MSQRDADGWTVEVTYPLRIDPEDNTWLQAVANRHHGKMGFVREIHPPRQDIHFTTRADAEAFATEVGASLRWRAGGARPVP